MWNVKEDGSVEGKLAYNGLFGWLALGLRKAGGAHNGTIRGSNPPRAFFEPASSLPRS